MAPVIAQYEFLLAVTRLKPVPAGEWVKRQMTLRRVCWVDMALMHARTATPAFAVHVEPRACYLAMGFPPERFR